MNKLVIFVLTLCLALNSFAQNLKQYTGTYKAEYGPFATLEISVLDGKLFGIAEGQGSSYLSSTDAKDEFKVDDYNGLAVFERNENQHVHKVTLKVNGESLICNRMFPDLQEYAGHYTLEGAPVPYVDVRVADGTLLFSLPEMGEGPVSFTGEIDYFYGDTYQSDIYFQRNEDREVVGMKIYVQGSTIIGTKKKIELTGTYNFDAAPFQSITVSKKDGKMYGTADTGEGSVLSPTDNPLKFKIPAYDAEATFSQDGTSLTLQVNGETLMGKKE